MRKLSRQKGSAERDLWQIEIYEGAGTIGNLDWQDVGVHRVEGEVFHYQMLSY